MVAHSIGNAEPRPLDSLPARSVACSIQSLAHLAAHVHCGQLGRSTAENVWALNPRFTRLLDYLVTVLVIQARARRCSFNFLSKLRVRAIPLLQPTSPRLLGGAKASSKHERLNFSCRIVTKMINSLTFTQGGGRGSKPILRKTAPWNCLTHRGGGDWMVSVRNLTRSPKSSA